MKWLNKKLYFLIVYIIITIWVGVLSRYSDFAFMKYSFLPNKNVFTILCLICFGMISTIYYKNSANLSIDDSYMFRLHVLLIYVWQFAFFLYRVYFISLIIVLFNVVIVFLFTFHLYKFNKKLLIPLIIYDTFCLYVVIVNLLML